MFKNEYLKDGCFVNYRWFRCLYVIDFNFNSKLVVLCYIVFYCFQRNQRVELEFFMLLCEREKKWWIVYQYFSEGEFSDMKDLDVY